MSDPVSNHDIEDVLSSIRRLVSEEPTARRSKQPPKPAGQDRLVLTPALRVLPDAQGENAQDGRDQRAKGEAKVTSDDPTAFLAAITDNVTGEDADRAAPQPVQHVDGSAAPASDLPSSDATPSRPRNAGKVSIDQAPEDAEAPPAPLTLTEPARARTPLPQAYEATEDWTAPKPESKPSSVERLTPDPDSPFAKDTSLERRIAELEAAIQQAPQHWEPDGSEDGSDDESRPLSADVAEGTSIAREHAPSQVEPTNDQGSASDTEMSDAHEQLPDEASTREPETESATGTQPVAAEPLSDPLHAGIDRLALGGPLADLKALANELRGLTQPKGPAPEPTSPQPRRTPTLAIPLEREPNEIGRLLEDVVNTANLASGLAASNAAKPSPASSTEREIAEPSQQQSEADATAERPEAEGPEARRANDVPADVAQTDHGVETARDTSEPETPASYPPVADSAASDGALDQNQKNDPATLDLTDSLADALSFAVADNTEETARSAASDLSDTAEPGDTASQDLETPPPSEARDPSDQVAIGETDARLSPVDNVRLDEVTAADDIAGDDAAADETVGKTPAREEMGPQHSVSAAPPASSTAAENPAALADTVEPPTQNDAIREEAPSPAVATDTLAGEPSQKTASDDVAAQINTPEPAPDPASPTPARDDDGLEVTAAMDNAAAAPDPMDEPLLSDVDFHSSRAHPSDQPDPDHGEPLLLDEDALRAIISDAVRQELTGVLGERITRNIRRLVRREIQRALTVRDLE